MSICLSHISADHILEALALSQQDLEPISASDPSMFSANTEEALRILSDSELALDTPINLLVGNARALRHSRDVIAHVWMTSLPDGSILKIDEELYVCSAEFCLLQQANELHMINLCQMLGRFLSTKVPIKDIDGSEKFVDRPPLTNEEQILTFLSHIGKAPGAAALRSALRWTAAGAASPQEVNLQLALTLPPTYGGFSLPKPIMNYCVTLSDKSKQLYDHESIRIDLCWPSIRKGLEYQGKEHGNQLGEDYARYLAAESEGYHLWFVAAEQLASAPQMDFIARTLARKLRKNTKRSVWPKEQDVKRLLDILTGHAIPARHEKSRWRRPKGSGMVFI